MHILEVQNGKIYESVWLRETYREGKAPEKGRNPPCPAQEHPRVDTHNTLDK